MIGFFPVPCYLKQNPRLGAISIKELRLAWVSILPCGGSGPRPEHSHWATPSSFAWNRTICLIVS